MSKSSLDDFVQLLDAASKVNQSKKPSSDLTIEPFKAYIRDYFSECQPVADVDDAAEKSCYPKTAVTACDKTVYVISWIIRAYSILTQTIIWMPLHIATLELLAASDISFPIEPNSFLVLSALMSAWVTYYFIDPYQAWEAYKNLLSEHQGEVLACTRLGARLKFACIVLPSLILTPIAATLFLPIVLELPKLTGFVFPRLVDFLLAVSDDKVFYQIFFYWMPNFFMHVYSGLYLSRLLVDFFSYLFRGKLVWLDYQRLQYFQKLQSESSMHQLSKAIVSAYRDQGNEQLQSSLSAVLTNIDPGQALAAACYYRERQSAGSRLLTQVFTFLLLLAIHSGNLSFYLAGFRVFPLELVFVEMIVSSKTMNQLATGMVSFIKQVPDLKNRTLHWVAGLVLGVILFACNVYTCLGVVAEIFLQNTAHCLNNVTEVGCSEYRRSMIGAEVVLSSFVLFLCNMDPMFRLFLLIQSWFLSGASRLDSSRAKRKCIVESFKLALNEKLSEATLSDFNSLAEERQVMPVKLRVDGRWGGLIGFLFFMAASIFSVFSYLQATNEELNTTSTLNSTLRLQEWKDLVQPEMSGLIGLLCVGDLIKRIVFAIQSRAERIIQNKVLAWLGVFLPFLPSLAVVGLVLYLLSNLIELSVGPELINMTQAEQQQAQRVLQVVMCGVSYMVISHLGDEIESGLERCWSSRCGKKGSIFSVNKENNSRKATTVALIDMANQAV